MVLTGGVASLILGVFIIFYHFYYPKKNINLLVLLLLISVLPLISIFRAGSYQSGDLSLHARYVMDFYNNIKQGNIIPQWAGNDCSRYGCPEFIFIFFLPYLVISLLHMTGISFIFSIKILLIVSYLFSGIGMYFWMKDELGKVSGFVAAIFYLFAPYHLIDMHFRVSIGEMISFALLPFAFLFIKRLVESKKYMYFFLTSLSLACLIISHQPTALFSFPILFFYGIIVLLRKPKKVHMGLLSLAGSFILSLLFSTFYWLPLLAESKYITFTSNAAILYFPITQYLYSPDRFGFLFQGHKGELYTIVGYIQLFIVFFSFYFLFRKKIRSKEKILLLYFLGIFFIYFIFMQSFTKPLWDILPLLKNIQFAYRLMLEISFAVAVIAGIIAKTVNKKAFLILLCSITIISTILNWGNRKPEPTLTDSVLSKQSVFPEKPGLVEVSTPIWVNRNAKWIGTIPKKPIQTLSGKASFVIHTRSQTVHTYTITVTKNALIKENTYYFPGWKLFINNREQHIDYLNKVCKGVITFPLKKGIYNITLQYSYLPISVFAQRISLGIMLISLLFFFSF